MSSIKLATTADATLSPTVKEPELSQLYLPKSEEYFGLKEHEKTPRFRVHPFPAEADPRSESPGRAKDALPRDDSAKQEQSSYLQRLVAAITSSEQSAEHERQFEKENRSRDPRQAEPMERQAPAMPPKEG